MASQPLLKYAQDDPTPAPVAEEADAGWFKNVMPAITGAMTAAAGAVVDANDYVRVMTSERKITLLARAYVSVSEGGVISKHSARLLHGMWMQLDPNWLLREDLLLLPKVTKEFNVLFGWREGRVLKQVVDSRLAHVRMPQMDVPRNNLQGGGFRACVV